MRKRVGNTETEASQTVAAKSAAYQSPYSQAKSRGVIKRKPGKVKWVPVKTLSGDPGNDGSQMLRHRTVDELMNRISTKQQKTLCVSDSRLKDKEISHESSVSVMEAPRAGYKGPESSLAFLTSGPDGDDISVGSGVLSAGSFGSFGSYASLKSAISICESQVAPGSKKVKTFEVDIQTKQGALIRQKRSLQSLIKDIESNAKGNNLPPVFVPHFDEMPETMISWNGKNNLKPSKKMIERQKRKEEKARLLKMAKKGSNSNHPNERKNLANTIIPAAHHQVEPHDDDLTVDDDLGSVGSSVGFGESTLGIGDYPNSKKKAHVDIIGMYQTVPLILARADERCRKREKAVAAKNQISEEKRRALMELIRHKMSRPERYAEELRHKQLCVAWLKLIPAILYNHTYSKIYPPIFHIHGRNKEEFWAIMILTRVVKKFINYKMEKKIRGEFLAKIQSSFWILSMAVRAKRKQFAVKKIKFFFSLFQGKNRIKFVVHRFVQSALMMQRSIRNFIVCTRSRIDSLQKVWNEVECAYILDILEKRQREQGSLLAGLGGGSKDGGEDIMAKIDGKMKIEMQKQSDRWKESEARMDALLQRHRKAGLIDKANLHEVAQKMVLDVPEKYDIISAYIRTRRRIYISEKDEAARKVMKESQTFAVSDATDLLQGNTEKINNTVLVRMAMIRRYGATSFGMPLFDDNNTVDQVKDIFKKHIERMHKAAGTFVVKETKKRKLKRNKTQKVNSKKV